MIKRNALFLVLLAVAGPMLSQEQEWTLNDCYDYARENNLALQRQELQTRIQERTYKERIAQALPSLTGYSNVTTSMGRSIDPQTNTYTLDQNFSNYYSLSSSVTLFNGFAQLNRINASRFMYKSGMEEQKKQENLLMLDITNAYYQVLITRGMSERAREQVSLSELQLKQTRLLYETGKESATTVYQLESQVSSDKLLYTQAKNNAALALEDLRQLLHLDPGAPFKVVQKVRLEDLDYEGPVAAEIYEEASQTLPRIKAMELRVLSMKKSWAAAKGAATPALGGFATWRTDYFTLNKEGYDPDPFFEQIENNNRKVFGFSLNIPLFNGLRNYTQIKTARINYEDSRLQLEQENEALYKEINSATLGMKASYDEYVSASDNVEYSRKALDATEKKFLTGLANAAELAEAKKQLFAATISKLQAELQFQLQSRTLHFYKTGTWGY